MTAQEFVKQITTLKPKVEEVIGLDYSDDFLDHWLKGFDITPIANNVYDDPLITLIKNYDVSSLSICDITLDPEFQEDDDFFFFGWNTFPDRQAIYKPSGRIVSYDGFGERITFQCAENSAKFLDALVEVMKFSKERMLNDYQDEEIDKQTVQVAYIAALKAGGEEYEDYYKALI